MCKVHGMRGPIFKELQAVAYVITGAAEGRWLEINREH